MAWLSALVETPQSSARSESSMTFWVRMTWIRRATVSTEMPGLPFTGFSGTFFLEELPNQEK